MKLIKILPVALILLLLGAGKNVNNAGCRPESTSNDVQREQSNRILSEGTSQVGMPSIKNFRERKLLKQILELRDQADVLTFTYTISETTGKKTLLCKSIGYGIPYATQFTAPESVQTYNFTNNTVSNNYYGVERLPQADPNGLFSPPSADGTWVMCFDPSGNSKEVKPMFIEPRIIVSPFRLKED